MIARPATDGVQRLLDDFSGTDLLARVDWNQWLDIVPPFDSVAYATQDVVERYSRNGYEWDIHGTLYEPARESRPGVGFVLFHGGAGSEKEVYETPDGRPGLAAVLAAQGFRCLAVTYPGHYPPGGEWTDPVSTRQPHYLLDRSVSIEEIRDRNLRCTFNTILQGAALLADNHMRGYDLIAFGHSTGGPMSIFLHGHLEQANVIGIVGWASGGPDGWQREWTQWVGARPQQQHALDSFARRTTEFFRQAGYEDEPALCPWGMADGYMKWGDRFKSQIKTGVCDNQHDANIDALKKYPTLTGIPEHEYTDHLRDPDPDWLARTGVLLLVGERDRLHWLLGEALASKLEMFMGMKFSQRTPWTRVVTVPRYAHFGYVALHNERIAYTWLWALVEGYFGHYV